MIIGGLLAGFVAVEIPGEGVIAKLDRPGEVVIQLDAIEPAAPHNLTDQTKKALPHTRMGRIQPGHRLAMQHHLGAAIALVQHPSWVALHHLGIGRLHQAILKPGNHLQATPVGRLGEPADWIELGGLHRQGGLHGGIAGAVKGGATAPHIRVERVEARRGQFGHGLLNPGCFVIKRTWAIGEPHADAAQRCWRRGHGGHR